ncbi:uncharacterized protein LOC128145747 isoform X3 [Harpia harpyja]|uniref:uncharacterized protein LOC128145747 isoform X3 n=1 Tax=Harpia harpyja TaxID=202280 RepID=UPI0022B1E461|nr:uncharacterized protein LOC128145747 isoform X3 [Harpia harpyja]
MHGSKKGQAERLLAVGRSCCSCSWRGQRKVKMKKLKAIWPATASCCRQERACFSRGSIEDLVVDSSLGMLLTVSGSGAAVAEAREARRSAYTESRSFLLLTPPHQQGGWGGTRSSEGTQLGQLMPTDPRDIPDHMTSCSAYKAMAMHRGWQMARASLLFLWCCTGQAGTPV